METYVFTQSYHWTLLWRTRIHWPWIWRHYDPSRTARKTTEHSIQQDL